MTHSKLLTSLILAALVAPSVAMAEDAPSPFTANVGFTTDYIFRGIAQTSHNAAIQSPRTPVICTPSVWAMTPQPTPQ